MSQNDDEPKLIASVAEQHGIPAELLRDLLDLSDDFPNVSHNRSKTRLLQRVTDLLDASSENAP